MIRKKEDISYVCDCCGIEFSEFEEDNYGLATEHNNYTNDDSMKNFVFSFLNGDENKKYKLFISSIMLDNNLCNLKDVQYENSLQIFECRILWLKNNDCNRIATYLENNRENIKIEFNKITDLLIEEKKKEIETLKLRYI